MKPATSFWGTPPDFEPVPEGGGVGTGLAELDGEAPSVSSMTAIMAGIT